MGDTANLDEAKKTISKLVIKEPGVSAVGTGRDELGCDAVVIDMDPAFPDTRERITKLIEKVAADVRVVYTQGGPYRKFPAT